MYQDDLAEESYEALLSQESQQDRPHYPPASLMVQSYRSQGVVLLTLARELQLSQATISHARALMNRLYTGRRDDPAEDPLLQLDLLCCLWIAAKLVELTGREPLLEELLQTADGQYTAPQLVERELHILNLLDWDLTEVTPACIFDILIPQTTVGDPVVDRHIRRTTTMVLNLALMDLHCVRFPPSLVFAAALKTARQHVRVARGGIAQFAAWDAAAENLTRYTAQNLQPCASRLTQLHAAYLANPPGPPQAANPGAP